jgi:S-DNA-T family DNA segregation ATPase FtsK/SpoIIIE
MKLKLTLQPEGGASSGFSDVVDRDIMIETQPTTKVGEIASYLRSVIGDWEMSNYKYPTLAIITPQKKYICQASSYFRDSKLIDGMNVTLTSNLFDGSAYYLTDVYGVLRDLETDCTYALYQDTIVGRAQSCDALILNRQVSRLHCSIHISDFSEVSVEDLGSKNGTKFDASNNVITIGTLNFRLEIFQTRKKVEIDNLPINSDYNRYHNLPSLTEPENIDLPNEPEIESKPKLNILSMAIPLTMGGVFYFMMPSPMTAIFMMMSPLMIFGNWITSRFSVKKKNRLAKSNYEEELSKSEEEIDSKRRDEVSKLHSRYPMFEQIPLWSKHWAEEDFSRIRIGLGDSQSVITVAGKHKQLPGVPILTDLSSGLGLVGCLELELGLFLQILKSYSPGEVQIGIIQNSPSLEFEWLKWSQHILPELVSISAKSQASVLDKLSVLVQSRMSSSGSGGKFSGSSSILVFVNSCLPENWARLESLANLGKSLGVYFIWYSNSEEGISWQMNSVISESSNCLLLRSAENSALQPQEVGSYLTATPGVCEKFVKETLRVKDLSKLASSNEGIPQLLRFADLVTFDSLGNTDHIVQGWSSCTKPLSAKVGVSSSDKFELDLRKQGPHCLVGGTTGAGKSEFLQTWITSLALSSSPSRLNFLLVDYKGGSAFSSCAKFPHTVGMVTDLDLHLARRVMVSLSAELSRREVVLNEYGAKDLETMEQININKAPANLVIVVDEFAALASELPEFVDQIVDIAARGRSLGIHLILATQRPSGVIKDNIKANTNLRIALRVSDTSESNDIIGTPSAIDITRDTPGRLFCKFDNQSPIEVQSGYIGYSISDESDDIFIYDFHLGNLNRLLPSQQILTNTHSPLQHTASSGRQGETYLMAITKQLQYAYLESGLTAPHRPWCEPLLNEIPLNLHSPHFGLVDFPAQQTQEFQDLPQGNMLITGTSGCGKTTALITAISCLPQEDLVYIIDAGHSNFLAQIDGRAQIIELEESEKLFRLLKSLLSCSKNTEAKLPGKTLRCRTVLIIDRIDLLKDELEKPNLHQLNQAFSSLLSNTSALAVQIIATQGRPGGIYSNWMSVFTQRIFMQLNSESEYSYAGLNPKDVPSLMPPGHALFNGNEMQICISNSDSDSSNLPRSAPVIKILEQRYTSTLDSNFLGIQASDLTQVQFPDPTPELYIIGPPKSGKSTVEHLFKQHYPDTEIIVSSITEVQSNWELSSKVKSADLVVLLGVDANEASMLIPGDFESSPFVGKSEGRGFLVDQRTGNPANLLQFILPSS